VSCRGNHRDPATASGVDLVLQGLAVARGVGLGVPEGKQRHRLYVEPVEEGGAGIDAAVRDIAGDQ